MTLKREFKRRTKIIVTLGPALDDLAVLREVFKAGADVFRMNFSHGNAEDHTMRYNNVRQIAAEFSKEVAIFADLQGPKIRISRFKDKKIHLNPGDVFTLDGDLPKEDGTQSVVGIDYKELPRDLKAGDVLLLDDGRLVFDVTQIVGNKIICRVQVGGELSNNKGINRQGGGLSAKALTDKDKADLKIAVKLGVDYIAISFPRSKEDVEETRALLKAENSSIGIISKIERTEALTHIEEIIAASDAVMVARGDLGVEIGDAEVPGVQKRIIHLARAMDKVAITATQMMESMIVNPIPTRAEISDVANAVLDGTDAVMLSAESATGAHPVEAVAAMARVCLAAEKQPTAHVSRHRVECHFNRPDEAIAMATMYIANHLDISAILALTESGSTPLWMSRIRSNIPIYGLSRNLATRRKMALYRGVYSIDFDATKYERPRLNQKAVEELERLHLVNKNDLVVITKGDLVGVHGRTNSMKIFTVGMFDEVEKK